MSVTEDELRHAEARSVLARKQLATTLLTLQNRLNPRALAADAAEELREKAVEMFDEGIAAAKARPGMVAAIVAMILAYLFRGPIFRAVSAMIERKPETRPTAHELTAQAISKAAARPPTPNRKKERDNDERS